MTCNAVLALAQHLRMTVHSDLLGPLDTAEDELISFADGLFGFPECRRFVLVQTDREGLFWLQSVEHSALAFLLVDPFLFFDEYSVDLLPADMEELRVSSPADVAILAIVTLPRSRHELPTANLQGPVAMNLRLRSGKQLAISETEFGIRCPFQL